MAHELSDTFTLIPLQIDPSTKAVSSSLSSKDAKLKNELEQLNTLHRSLVGLDTPNAVPAPPVPVKPHRTQQINKLRETASAALKKGSNQEAIKLFTLGIDMALGRPLWEPQGLVREELSGLYASRAQAYVATREWADGLIDCELSLEAKKHPNLPAWSRKGKCQLELGKLHEANETIKTALDYEKSNAELLALEKEITAALQKSTPSA